jgi:alpha-1,2-mannosyltransferase
MKRSDSRLGPTDRVFAACSLAVFGAVIAVIGLLPRYPSDFGVYYDASQRVLAGLSLFNPDAAQWGAFGSPFYPPPFAIFTMPFTVLPFDIAAAVWFVLNVAATVLAIALMPVRLRVRALILLLAAISWPLLWALKLGQIGPILMLLFVIGWRAIDRPPALGAVIAVGAAIKIQPILLVGWALLTARWRAAAWAAVVLTGVAVVTTVVLGPQAWLEEIGALSTASFGSVPIHDLGPAGIARLAGFTIEDSQRIAAVHRALVLLLLVFAARRASPEASYLAFVLGSQMVSPVLWDHYSIMLLLPVAWLLDHGQLWSVIVPASASIALNGLVPLPTTLLTFWLVLLALIWFGDRARAARAETVATVGGLKVGAAAS